MQLDSSSYLQLQILGSVSLAMLLGALLGVDREFSRKPAGLRTHMLVSGAAALLVALGETIVRHFGGNPDYTQIQTDPMRIMEAVITGVSFLGAGTIIRHNSSDRVEGLTTAASLLLAAAVGVAVALSQFILAVGSTILALLILRGVQVISQWMEQR